ncbi:MAG: hypothetical protein DI539_23485 [Flavobacterium psychrophilum]|jgi:hypothetical protein|nr:MAG: hypothetical protein DI539_23485 [Flavobacterium psychrophilum]
MTSKKNASITKPIAMEHEYVSNSFQLQFNKSVNKISGVISFYSGLIKLHHFFEGLIINNELNSSFCFTVEWTDQETKTSIITAFSGSLSKDLMILKWFNCCDQKLHFNLFPEANLEILSRTNHRM